MPYDSNPPQEAAESSLPRVNRRRLMALTGAGAVGAIAGCLDADDDPEGDLVSTEFVTTYLATQEDVQFNPHNLTLPPEWNINAASYVMATVQSNNDGETYPIALEDYDVGTDQVSATLLDGLTWHDGEAVTAEDYQRTLQLAYYMNAPIANFVESAEDIAVEGDTVVVQADQEYNPTIFINDVLNTGGGMHIGTIYAHEELYGGFIEDFEDANEDGREDVQSDFAEYTVRPDELEPYANGPFEFDEMDPQGVHYVKYDDYPWAAIQDNLEDNWGLDLSDFPDEPNWDEYLHRFFIERPQIDQAGMAGEIDGGDGFEIDFESDLEMYPDYADWNPIVSGWTDAFVFNWVDGEHADMWRDGRVRKAFAHIIDFDAVREQYHGEYGYVDRYFNGMSPPMEAFVPDDWNDQLTHYDHDFDRAEELLEDAGLYEEDGQWYKPNDEPFEVEWSGPSTVRWQVDGMTVASDNLNEFGIDSTVTIVEGGTYFGSTLPNLDYELARGFIGFGDLITGWELTWWRYDSADDDEEPFSYYLQEPYGEPGLEVPPIGEPNSDETITIDPLELLDEIRTVTDDDRLSEISQELSWAFNQTVPKLPGSAGPYGWFMTERWEYPDFEDHPLGGVMPYTYSLPQIGALAAQDREDFDG